MRILLAALTLLCLVATARAQDIAPESPALTPLQALLQEHRAAIEQGARRGIGPAIEALRDSGLPEARSVLEKWQARELWLRKSDGLFFLAEPAEGGYRLIDPATGETAGSATRDEVTQIRPNSGIRAVLAGALVQFQLTDPNPAVRAAALDAIARRSEATHLDALRAVLEDETDPRLKARKARLERLLTISFDPDPDARIAAIEGFSGDIGVDVRAALNPLVATTRAVTPGDPPAGENIARRLSPGSDALEREAAYAMLVEAGLAPPRIGRSEIRAALAANVEDGRVGGVPVAELNSEDARERAYAGLAAAGLVPAHVTEAGIDAALAAHSFYDRYAEADPRVTDAASAALATIALMVGVNQMADLALDALSLASIYFLAAIGLAITFGVMRVINMAHGEFIMMGAYTGYVVQQLIPDYTISILVALPLAFAITFGAGVAMERLVIRWLYNRPLETLLATFGISIALQQLAKNIFGTQARPLTSPAWLDGALVINDVVSISYIRIAIFVLALLFLGLFLFIMRRTRLGLEVRAVTQNPRMAASMGINPDRINMLTFGLGSGIAGVAGVAIGLYAKVTSELGQDYIVQSFMTVVVGGVGNIWGTLLGATLIGFLQKGIEWFNPSNTLAAQTYMILFIILFIQFRPRGIIALKGRAAGD
ncbi:urea ABC transporter permease subunit UrtB [Rhodovulum strictum]|uniref:Urea ABC transporter permease subunit UrtB n=1 Tax=Rhodovulum strictum TaxID=58314 RepID=A0A844BIY7_9RHOB|nr:urea ABC transporter permease subunit UrtB [Rhodovulum strictum]MRH21515.1 urea ABC transporter permease subunit UrtB [Rhodovulum strictum]